MKNLLWWQAEEPAHFYVHIPYCINKCPYCDFCSWSFRDASMTVEEYFQLLHVEIERKLKNPTSKKLKTIYFGGGTPSAVPSGYLDKIMQTIQKFREFSEDCEITLEVNPASSEYANFQDYIDMGFNRISIGLQSSLEEGQRKLGRIHSTADFLTCLSHARNAGFTNISSDLILAWPGQTMEDLEKDLDFILGLGLRHISVYSLIIEEATPFAKLYKEGEYPLPSPETERDMAHFTRRRLQEAGYSAYEISNYAKSGYESRHNLAYWNGESYHGVGLSASSYVYASRRTNPNSFEEYKSIIKSGQEAEEQEYVDFESAKKEFFIFRLRKAEGFSQSEYEERFHESFSSQQIQLLNTFLEEGYLLLENSRYFYSELGWDFADYVARAFI